MTKTKTKMSDAMQIEIYDLMIKARVMEERLIRMSKSGLGFFWIGGPGEEAFNVPLGFLIKKGEGLDYDFLHFHYRQSATLLAMGIPMIDPIRQMHDTATDPYSGGRNFVNHFAIKKWNVVNVTSPIEVQYALCIGSGVAQKRHGGDAITIVTGGDAGTAEGEFASCLIWASRKGRELPILIIVTNNKWGISTPASEVQPGTTIASRGEAMGIKSKVISGNDPLVSYAAIEEAMAYVRKERKPYLLEVMVSRLYGHSSASGANWVNGEDDCIVTFEKHLKEKNILKTEDFKKVREKYEKESVESLKQVMTEAKPDPNSIFDHVFVDRKDCEIPKPHWMKQAKE
ncbi:MAG: thiamine pyrophosphate-dependent dehydrogenase E1 component subunit alpha [Deltaproteobacteria bacterium]|nr:thiamine pyrophosphate-dependent dehydrogenase E1 component subunit alpha [Deltaproteobacteria bacterium]